MKRTNLLTTVISLLLFAAVLIYVGVWSWNSFSGSFVTTEAVTAKVTVGGSSEGIVIRNETVLTSNETYLDITTAEGAHIGVGRPIATAMSTETGLTRATRIHTLEKSIELTSAALKGSDASGAADQAQAASSLVKTLTRSVARGEVSDIESTAITLGSSVLADNGAAATAEELENMRQELASLKASSSSDTYELTSDVSGTFCTTVDGYEYLTPSKLTGLTPSGLMEIMEGPSEVPDGAYAKVLTSIYWYYACVMDSNEADALQVDTYAGLDFGRYYSGVIYGKVISMSTHEDGKTAVVFQFDEALSDTMGMRQVSAQVILNTYEGVRIPAQAVQYDEENSRSYVYTVTALKLERKNITIIYADDEWCIVKRNANSKALREGNTVVVKGRNLFDGKIVE